MEFSFFSLSFRGASVVLAVNDKLQDVANALGRLDTFRGTTTTTTYDDASLSSTTTETVEKAYANGVVVSSPAGFGRITPGDEIEV